MARLKFLLAFLALVVCAGGVGGAWFYWKKFAEPELEVSRRIAGKDGADRDRPDLGKRHFDAALALLREGELVSGRDRLLYLLKYFPESATCPEARRVVGEVNLDLLLSKIPMEGKSEYKVRRGDALLNIASRNQTTIDYIMRVNGKTTEFIYPDEGLTVFPLKFRVEIDLKRGTVTVLDGENLLKEYPIVDRNLPPDLKAPVSTTVSERVAWLGDRPVNFTHPDYMGSAKWIRTGRIGLFIRQADPGPDGGEARPFGVMLENPDLEEIFTILRVGSKVDLVK